MIYNTIVKKSSNFKLLVKKCKRLERYIKKRMDGDYMIIILVVLLILFFLGYLNYRSIINRSNNLINIIKNNNKSEEK